MRRSVTIVVVALFLIPLRVASQFQAHSSTEPVFRHDLRPLGLVTDKTGFFVYSNNDSVFLSNDLVLVSLNRTEVSPSFVSRPTTPGEMAEPPTLLLVFSLSQKKMVSSITRPHSTFPGSLQGLLTEGWIAVSGSGVQLCSDRKKCTLPFPTNGELSLPSPSRDRWAEHHQSLLLNDERTVELQESAAVVMTLDRTPVYQIPVRDVYRETSFVPCASGSRFLINEFAYTRLNSIVNFWDGKASRPRNLKRVRLFDVPSGKTLFERRWAPHRLDDDMPALSPDGRRVALVKQGILEVYEIP
jgi:hypothetical protein